MCKWERERADRKGKREKQFVLRATRLLLPHPPMSDEAAGDLEMIDGPSKYGHYHIGSPCFHPHYSLSSGATKNHF